MGLTYKTVKRWKNRKYLFVAIDRASCWVYLDIFPDKSAKSAETFLMNVVEDFLGKITKLLTDNGKEFTDRFCRSILRQNWRLI